MSHGYGKFYVTKQLVALCQEGLSDVLSIMEFIPIYVRFDWRTEKFEYEGLSPLFREVEMGTAAPEYHLTIHSEQSKVVLLMLKSSRRTDMLKLIRKYTQCLFGIHWRMKYDSGLVNDIGRAGTCSDCGYRTEGIQWSRMPLNPHGDDHDKSRTAKST